MSKNKQNFYDAILTELRRVMDENKITQAEIGENLGIKQSAVSSLLSGKSRLTIEQFLAISDLLGIRPHQLLSSAESLMAKTVPMPYEIEEILYKSEAHLVAYCAATQEISLADVTTEDYPKEKMKAALEDLVSVGVLKKTKDKYVQTHPHITYTATSRFRSQQCRQKVMIQAWNMWERLREKPAFRLRRFTLSFMDRFTVGQMKEIEAILWRAHERLQVFQRENISKSYISEEPMPLWYVHLMLTTPLDQK